MNIYTNFTNSASDGFVQRRARPDAAAFLDAVLPEQGRRCIGALRGGVFQNIFQADNRSAEAAALKVDSDGKDAYIALAGFGEEKKRTQANVVALRTLWLDIDTQENKPKERYADRKEAAAALTGFCKEVGLPTPWVVSSGYGLHVYFPFTEDVTPDQWGVVSRALKDAVDKWGLAVDPSRTTDSASVLRMPGTANRKSGGSAPVKILKAGLATDVAEILHLLTQYVGVDPLAGPPPKMAAAAINADLINAREFEPSDPDKVADHCAQVSAMRSTRGNLSQPLWYAAIGVVAHCEGGEDRCQEWSIGHPDYRDDETEAKVAQALKFGPTTCDRFQSIEAAGCASCPHRGKVTSPIQLGRDMSTSTTSVDVKTMLTGSTWPEPRPISSTLYPVPSFDLDFLAGPLQRFVDDESSSIPAPRDFTGTGALVMCGGILGNRVAINFKKHGRWVEPPTVWGFGVGTPSVAKTPSVRGPREGLSRADARYDMAYQAALSQYHVDRGVFDQLKKQVASGGGSGLVTLPPEPVEPRPRRTFTNNSTPEALAVMIQHNPTGVLLYLDELSGWLSTLGEERSRTERAFYLEAWNALNAYRTNRIGRGEINIPQLTATVLGFIQPEPLVQLLVNGTRDGSQADGLMQRFGMMTYPDPTPHLTLIDRPIDMFAYAAGVDAMASLADFDPVARGASTIFSGPPHFALSEPAYGRFCAWYEWHLAESRNDDLLTAYREHVRKLPRVIANVALLIHVLEGFSGDISDSTMRRAIAACEYFTAHARRIYGLSTEATLEPARQLAGRMSRGTLGGELNAREAQRNGWAGCHSPESTAAVFEVLEEHGWVQEITTATATNRGRPPSKCWLVNTNAQGKNYK